MSPSSTELLGRLQALGRLARAVSDHLPDVPGLAAVRDLAERGGTRLALSATEHTVVALAGATGSGKSTLFNAIAGLPLSPPGHLRPTTAKAHACVWGDADATALLDWMGVSRRLRFRRESLLDGADEASLHGLVLLDLPDVDSVAAGHRAEAHRLVGVVDLVIWVLDPQKYADQTIHDDYLSRMGALRDVTMVVFNQTDRLSVADAERCRADLERLVAADGLPGIPVAATSARTGAGVDDVRAALEKAVAGRHAALARLEGELEVALECLAPTVGAAAVDEATIDAAVAALGEDLVAAAGIETAAVEADRAYRRQAAIVGWSSAAAARSFASADAAVEIAAPADLAPAVRRLATALATGLPASWADRVRSAASGRLDELPSRLSDALVAAHPGPSRGRVWSAVRFAWWVCLLTAAVEVGWLAWTFTAGGPSMPPSSIVVLAVAGAVAVLLPAVSTLVARRRGRLVAALIRSRLRDAAIDVARETAAPAQAVLHSYEQARTALAAAS